MPALLRKLGGKAYRVVQAKRQRAFANVSAEEGFTRVYKSGAWGRAANADPFFSGLGSHSDAIVRPYLTEVGKFLESFNAKMNAVDLGCGDFHVGAQIRHHCAKYVACDVVPALIKRNSDKFSCLNVDFRVIDIVETEEYPDGDIVFIRQVLQHLSNFDISRVVNKVAKRYKYAIVTEHLPAGPFTPNLDHLRGPTTRLPIRSGVVLTEAPFNLSVRDSIVLCEIKEGNGIIRTNAYTF